MGGFVASEAGEQKRVVKSRGRKWMFVLQRKQEERREAVVVVDVWMCGGCGGALVVDDSVSGRVDEWTSG
jgi:hypothetical protein